MLMRTRGLGFVDPRSDGCWFSMALQPDDSEAQHGPVICRLPPAAGLGQGEGVPMGMQDQSELLEEGTSTTPWRVERHLLGRSSYRGATANRPLWGLTQVEPSRP